MGTVAIDRLTKRQYADAQHALHHAEADEECQTPDDAKTELGRSLTRGCRILRQLLQQVQPSQGEG